MKKILILFFVLFLIAASLMAQKEDDGIGLTAGLEIGVIDFEDFGDAFYIQPMFIFETSFGDLDLYAEAAIPFWFKPDFWIGADIDFSLTYNLFPGSASILSFILESWSEIPFIDYKMGTYPGTEFYSELIPGVNFTQEFEGAGDFYAQVDVPLALTEDPFEFSINLTLGWDSTFGLGLKFVEKNTIKPDAGYGGLNVTFSMEIASVYYELEVVIPKKPGLGFTIIPEVDYTLSAFTFYINAVIDNIGADNGNVGFGMAAGMKFRY